MVRRIVDVGSFWRPKNTPKTHPQCKLDFSDTALMIFWRFWFPKSTIWHPKAIPKRSKNASAIQPRFSMIFHRFWLPFKWYVDDFGMFLGFFFSPVWQISANFSPLIDLLSSAGVQGVRRWRSASAMMSKWRQNPSKIDEKSIQNSRSEKGRPKIEKNWGPGRQRVEKLVAGVQRASRFWPGGPRPRVWKIEDSKTRSHTPMGRWPGELFIYSVYGSVYDRLVY